MDFVLAFGASFILNLIAFLIAFTKKTDKLTDFTYGASFVAIALAVYARGVKTLYSFFILVLVCLWAIRLASYLVIRIRKMGRDKRFDEMRGSFIKFGSFWLLQAVSAFIIMLPAIYVLREPPESLGALSILAAILWLVGFFFEGVGDIQKFRFINNPANKGKWIESGLWRYTRHPNYFGEITMWWAVYLLALPVLVGGQALIALAGPLWITVLILFVSGIPKLEQGADARWGNNPDYKSYKQRTPVLVPFVKF